MKKKLTPAQVSAIIKRKNKTFKKLTKPQKRVAIAKDVLKQIKDKSLIPDRYNYLIPASSFNFYESGGEELSTVLYNESCRVCALGSVFACIIKKENDFIIPNQSLRLEGDKYGADLRRRVRKYFSSLQMAMIESAYMRSAGYFIYEKIDRDKHLNIMNICEDYRSANNVNSCMYNKKALNLIMQNIIDNKGTFKP